MQNKNVSAWHAISWSEVAEPQLAPEAPDGRSSDAVRSAAVPTGAVTARSIPGVANVSPLREAQILLQAAAEVEHALLVQYLYALWSLPASPSALQSALRTAAIQEMGHLITVQNVLLFLGAEPYFQRQDASPQPELDPFLFSLEPLSLEAFERYVACESPRLEEVRIEWRARLEDILRRNETAGKHVNRVGAIYARLYWLLQEGDRPEGPLDVRSYGEKGRHIGALSTPAEYLDRQALPTEEAWREQYGLGMVFDSVASRPCALKAIARVTAQGEGPTTETNSHFERFFTALDATRVFPITMNLARNPFTGDEPSADPVVEAGRVTDALAAALCDLFDVRYRIMLTSLKAALAHPRSEQPDALRTKYISWALSEMTLPLRRLPARIVRRPAKPEAPGGVRAAPSFRLGSFELPDDKEALEGVLRSLHDTAAAALEVAAAAQPETATVVLLDEIRAMDQGRFALPEVGKEKGRTVKKVYRIHPAIGIARLGRSPNSFFLAPEQAGVGPIELTNDGAIRPVESYKDADLIRRQGVRFRVFESTLDESGVEQSIREITSAEAEIVWSVELANEKAAAGRFQSETQPETNFPRNPNVAPAELAIRPTFPSISGPEKSAVASTAGRFKGTDVYLGELRTDMQGRLIVLGGRGDSHSVPAGKPLGDGIPEPGHPLNDFANNEFWHDDTADGPVSATVAFAGEAPIAVEPAWVIVAPPDYSPHTRGLTTLYDIAFDAAVQNGHALAAPTPSFRQHILPVLQAASNLRWVSKQSTWERISRDYSTLSKTDTSGSSLRVDTADLLASVEAGVLLNFRFTETQRKWLQAWTDGNFIDDFASPTSPVAVAPAGLDRASLEQGMGGGFFPGIEAGTLLTKREVYGSALRLRTDPFTLNGVQQKPHAGWVTRNMACPWQADFLKCASERGGTWWPAQRPIEVFVDAPSGLKRVDWVDGVGNHKDLVERHGQLGFVVLRHAASGKQELVEQERDDALPR